MLGGRTAEGAETMANSWEKCSFSSQEEKLLKTSACKIYALTDDVSVDTREQKVKTAWCA